MSRVYGSKYDQHLSTKEIAKLIRKDIKEFSKAIKVSVTTDVNYIDINATDIAGFLKEDVRAALEQIVKQYNYDGSDILSEYSNVNFYSNVSVMNGY